MTLRKGKIARVARTDHGTHGERDLGDATRAAGVIGSRLAMLDGWRAISILLVLAGHMVPLGPKTWDMNSAVAALGMAIFFTLSGFLIVSILLRNSNVGAFLVRRFARILPLAWTAIVLSFAIHELPAPMWVANLLFYGNLPPFRLDSWSSHLWSLDVEMQFYLAVATIVLLAGRGGLAVVPIAAICVTAFRLYTGTLISIVTWFRIDEILSGGVLALVLHTTSPRVRAALARLPFWPTLILFLLSTRPEVPMLNYLRPYLTSIMVGITIVRSVPGVSRVLECKPLGYVATISYAVYIIHHYTMFGWLNAGQGLNKYAKRPIALAITFGLAHISTFYFERPFNRWAHRLTASWSNRTRGGCDA